MKVEISRPFRIGRVEATFTLAATGQAGDLVLEELAAATVNAAVLSFADDVLRHLPAATYSANLDRERQLDRLRQAAEAVAPGRRWKPAELIALARQEKLFSAILGAPHERVSKPAGVAFGKLLAHHGSRHLTVKGSSHARVYQFRPCEPTMTPTMKEQIPLPL